jgi:hypothetical protein
MIGVAFAQNLVKKLSATVGKFEAISNNQIDKLKLISKDRDLKKSLQTCTEARKSLGHLNSPVSLMNSIIKSLKTLITTAKNLIKILKKVIKTTSAIPVVPLSSPIPVPFAPGVVAPGIPMIYPTVGSLMSLSQIIANANGMIDKLESFLDNLSGFINTLSDSIKRISKNLQETKPLFNECSVKSSLAKQKNIVSNGSSDEYSTVSATIDSLIKDLNSEIPENLVENETSYRGYTFEVREIPGDYTSQHINKRFAVALNSQGIVVFQSKPSFATDKQILVAELKFMIDNELLNNEVEEN